MRIVKHIPERTVKESHAARDQRRAETRERVCVWCERPFMARNVRADYCDECTPKKIRSVYSSFLRPKKSVDGEGVPGRCLEIKCSCLKYVHVCVEPKEVCRQLDKHDVCIRCGHKKQLGDRKGRGGHDHIYVLLGVGQEQLYHEDGSELKWPEIFDFLYREFKKNPPHTLFQGFFLEYDFTQWLKHLPWDRAAALLKSDDKNYRARRKTNPNRRGGNNEPFPVQIWAPEDMECPIFIKDGGTRWQWQFDLMENRKRFKLRPQPCSCLKSNCQHVRGTKYVFICDVGPFFQKSFMSVIDPHNWDKSVVSDEEWMILQKGKANRDDAVLDEDMRRYNRLENEILVRVTDRLELGFQDMGVDLKKFQWFGPGQVAGKWLAPRVPKSKDIFAALPDELMYAAQCGYVAAWWDIIAHGHMPIETHMYDINSAYPYQIMRLPCLGGYENGSFVPHGEWLHMEFGIDHAISAEQVPDGFILVNALVEGSNPYIGAMLHREKNQRISRPHETANWYWIDELKSAIHAGLVDTTFILEAWHYVKKCNCPPPLREVAGLYERRLNVGKNSPLGIGAKLNYNAQYGKFAQTVGDNPPFLNWIYASRITSGCRTQITNAIATHPLKARGVLMVATDGILFLTEHPELEKRISTNLGEWSHEVKRHITLAKPGMYWDDSARDALAQGKAPQVKSRGISAAAFSAAIQEMDDRFDNWHGPESDGSGWPAFTYRLGFAMLTAKQALRQNRWEDVGRITRPEITLSMSSNMDVKRDPGYFDEEFRIYRSVPKARDLTDPINVWSMPYEPKCGPAQLEADGLRDMDGPGITDDGKWDQLISEALNAKEWIE